MSDPARDGAAVAAAPAVPLAAGDLVAVANEPLGEVTAEFTT